jgi:RNA polymerase sigma-70 factor (ECF subfamily)
MYAPTLGNQNRISPWDRPYEVAAKPSATAETELVRLLRAGDEATFRELIECYGPRIYRMAYGILRNREDAEDIAQGVFAKVYFSIKSFQARSSLYTWISRIAINECYDYLRRKRPIYASDSADDTLSARMQNVADRQPGADLAFMRRDFINKLLAHASEEERHLLIWKEVEGFSLLELSEMTGLREAAIKVKLFRARQKLARAAAQSSDSGLLARASVAPPSSAGSASQWAGVSADRHNV